MKKIILIISLILLITGPGVALAIEYADEPTVTLEIPFGKTGTTITGLGEYIQLLYEFIVIFIAIAAVVMLMFGGFKWATAAGNAGQVGSAKTTIINAVIGLVLALSSFLLLYTINPALVSLDTFKIPFVQMVDDVADMCKKEVEEGDSIYKFEDEETKIEVGTELECGKRYDDRGVTCWGPVCPKSEGQCYPDVGSKINGNYGFACQKPWVACNKIYDNTTDNVGLGDSQSSCNKVNELINLYFPGSSLGYCQWIDFAVGNDGCLWCHHDNYEKLANATNIACEDLSVSSFTNIISGWGVAETSSPVGGKIEDMAPCMVKFCSDRSDCYVSKEKYTNSLGESVFYATMCKAK